MWQRSFWVALTQACTGTVFVVVVSVGVYAQVMSSGSYQIQSDSINVGGGYSSSSNYVQESTAGEVATGQSTSANYSLKAGYQQMQEVYISLSTVADVVLSPAIGGLSGGVSNASTTFTIITDSPSGYQVTYYSALAPAMQGPFSVINNYTPAGTVPDFSFVTTSTQAHFGFSPEGVDIVSRYRDNGSVCGVGSGNTSVTCWDMVSTTPQQIVVGTDSNHPLGATTTLRFRVGIGNSVGLTAGTYTATTTLTAIPL
jgi:hypothetical protein